MASELRIGLTMREMHPADYAEPRDALARNWGEFMQRALPDAAWLPVPNLGARGALRYCAQWRLDALILTGGEDPGVSPMRDETELALLERFLAEGHPVLGVCRGLQLMWTALGGTLAATQGHAAVRHRVRVHGPLAHGGNPVRDVNSYHRLALCETDALPHPGIDVLARCDDGAIEAIGWKHGRAAAVMWHPERERTADTDDVAFLRRLFGVTTTP